MLIICWVPSVNWHHECLTKEMDVPWQIYYHHDTLRNHQYRQPLILGDQLPKPLSSCTDVELIVAVVVVVVVILQHYGNGLATFGMDTCWWGIVGLPLSIF